MTGPAPLAFPSGRTLASWWQQLASQQPRAMWFGHVLLHRLEVLVGKQETRPLDRLEQLVLHAVHLYPGAGADSIDRQLPLGRQVLVQVLRGFEREGLVQPNGGGWALTALGQQAVERQAYPVLAPQRKVFHFAVSDLPGRAPHFLHLAYPAAQPCAAPAEWTFDVRQLQTCFDQTRAWQEHHAFPGDLQLLQGSQAAGKVGKEPWQHVIVDRPERLTVVVLLTTTAEGEKLLGLPVRQEGWVLQTGRPVFALGAVWPEVFPELAAAVPAEDWQQAWHSWCQPRGLSALPEDVCEFRVDGHLLHLTVTRRLLERLRSARSETLRDEAWLLMGRGRLRRAALLKIVEAGSPAALQQK